MLSRKASSLVLASLLVGCSAVFPLISCVPVRAESTEGFSAMSLDPCGAVEKLVRETYPKALINKGRGEITFEYKAHKKNGFYPDRPAMVPGDGGIVGTVTLSPGEYSEADKGDIPSEKPNGFYTVLTMAPYSTRQRSHLLAKVIFPQEVPPNFKERFKALINSFNKGDEPTPVATETPKPESPAAATPEPAKAAPVKPKSNYNWAAVVRADYRLSFKFPTGFKEKINADKAGTTWTGTADGVNFTVIVVEPKNALITDDSRTQAMNSMMSSVGQGRKPKMEQAFNFQGLSAQEYTLSDAAGFPSKAIVCVSAGLQYLFMAGGQNFKASKLPPEFFDGVRIGKIK
jgi:hypothetical protein